MVNTLCSRIIVIAGREEMSDRLPQTMCLGGLQIVQTTNLHVTIYKDGKRVFHCQCD